MARPTTATGAELMTVSDVTEYLHVSDATLANWRYLKSGPRFVKAGGRVLYRRADIDAWLEASAEGGAA